MDVEFGRGRTLYALSQGFFVPGHPEGSPAEPDTGALVEVNNDGTFTEVFAPLDRPTSLEFIGNTAYVVTLGGEIWKIRQRRRSAVRRVAFEPAAGRDKTGLKSVRFQACSLGHIR